MTPDDMPLSSAPRRPGSLHERIVGHVRAMIVKGALEGGARIPEALLCTQLEVSRTPLREALKALSVEGLVILTPNRGATVAPLDPAALRDVFEAKGALEQFIGLHAAVRATDREIAELEGLHGQLVAAEQTGAADRYTLLNEAFHLALAGLARNAEILTTYERLQARILRARYRVNDDPSRVRASLAQHADIMAALKIRARNDLAERLVAHNADTALAVVAKLEASRA